MTDLLTDALATRMLDALHDLWSNAERDRLDPSTIATCELLEELSDD